MWGRGSRHRRAEGTVECGGEGGGTVVEGGVFSSSRCTACPLPQSRARIGGGGNLERGYFGGEGILGEGRGGPTEPPPRGAAPRLRLT